MGNHRTKDNEIRSNFHSNYIDLVHFYNKIAKFAHDLIQFAEN